MANACPGAGACGGMYTANTWPPPSRSWGSRCPTRPAPRPCTRTRPRSASPPVGPCASSSRPDLTPRKIVTRASLENAMAITMALGGSTNAVAPPDRHGPGLRPGANHRRLAGHLQPGPAAGRPQALRPVRHGGAARGRRHPGGHEVPPGRGLPRRLPDDGDRQDDRREPGRAARSGRRPGGRGQDREVGQAPGPHLHPAGEIWLPRGRWARSRARRASASRARPGCSTPRRTCWPASSRAGSAPATSSSSATRARRAARACPRC